MKILHIGWGFQPWRGGGLIEYAEDLMEIQHMNGYEVHYFFAGRHYPFFSRTTLKKWRKGKIWMHEIINSPILHAGDRGTVRPDLDIHEPVSEILFRQVLLELNPEVIHIHELAGLPSSFIEIIKSEFNIPLVMTLADYFLLCPTLKLFTPAHKNCTVEDIGNKCSVCCSLAPKHRSHLIQQTVVYFLIKLGVYKTIKAVQKFFFKKLIQDMHSQNAARHNARGTDMISEMIDISKTFQRRRQINTTRLKKIDLLIARSPKVREIYQSFLGNDKDIFVVQPTVKHLDSITPCVIRDIEYPIQAVTLNGCASVPKGAKLMLDTLNLLKTRGTIKYLQFHIFGTIIEDFEQEILSFKEVTYHGKYNLRSLDTILEGMHIGIIPSVWEEVFGYIGLELLAKGIPLIGNKKGGITEYTVEQKTGFINRSSTAEEMADILEKIINNPQLIPNLNAEIIKNRHNIIKTMAAHFNEMDEIYNKLILKKEI